MDEKQIWLELNKIIKKCERKHRRIALKREKASPAEKASASHNSRQKKYDVFMLAVDDIMHREHEVNMDITLRGDMARAFHITMAIGKYLWNQDETSMVGQIMQAGVEQVINQYNSEVVMKETRKFLKPILKELLAELEDEGGKE